VSNQIGIRLNNIRKIANEGEYTCKALVKLDDGTTRIDTKSIRLIVGKLTKLNKYKEIEYNNYPYPYK
jgi:hypothetical protein